MSNNQAQILVKISNTVKYKMEGGWALVPFCNTFQSKNCWIQLEAVTKAL